MTDHEPKVHEPGDCFDRNYGHECSGIAKYVRDPYIYEMQGRTIYSWLCDGVFIGKVQGI